MARPLSFRLQIQAWVADRSISVDHALTNMTPRLQNRHDPRCETGLTLIELIVAASMMVVITGAAVAMLTSAMRQQPELTERADQIGSARVGMEKMLREIRQGVVGSVSGTSSELKFESYVDGKCGSATVATATKCAVKYICGSGKCTRSTGGTGTSTTLVGGLTNSSFFGYVKSVSSCSTATGEPYTYVTVALEMRSDDGSPVMLQDGANLRSCA